MSSHHAGPGRPKSSQLSASTSGVHAKVIPRAECVDRFRPPRDARVVFTNGCFDILHPGHVLYLEAAKAFGDVLLIGVNTDASVRRLGKDPSRPLVPERDRALTLAGLGSVDAVTLFDEDTPSELISEIVPDVLVKGGDYGLDEVVGRETVERHGGRVEIIPFVEGYSTTVLVDRIRESES